MSNLSEIYEAYKVYKTPELAINAVLSELVDVLVDKHIDSFKGKYIDEIPDDLHIYLWVVIKEQNKTAIRCYYIRGISETDKNWFVREYDYQDFNEIDLVFCPLHFLDMVNLEDYDPLWIDSVRQYHETVQWLKQ